MSRTLGATVGLLAGVLLVIWWFRPAPATRAIDGADGANSSTGTLASSRIPISNSAPALAANAVEAAKAIEAGAAGTEPQRASNQAAPGNVPPLPELNEPSPRDVMENMRAAFRQYAARFNGNPVGTNPEITAALNAGNPKQIQFVNEADGLRINARGELVDSWGTPFFFHQLSATEMEIHSAGPDRKMWTRDDLVVK